MPATVLIREGGPPPTSGGGPRCRATRRNAVVLGRALAAILWWGVVTSCAGPGEMSGASGGGSVPGSDPGSALRDEVRSEIVRYYDDFSARDWRAFESHFW